MRNAVLVVAIGFVVLFLHFAVLGEIRATHPIAVPLITALSIPVLAVVFFLIYGSPRLKRGAADAILRRIWRMFR